MSIAAKLTKLETDITNAYNAISTKGGTIPSDKNTNNLSTAISNIPSGGIEPQTITGDSTNQYVKGFIAEAKTAYPNDPNRTLTKAYDYSIPSAGVRKDEPLPINVQLDTGDLTLIDEENDIIKQTTIESASTNLYNISPTGEKYILKDTDIEDVGEINPTMDARMIYAPSVYNVRDIGGWDTYNSNGVKEGTVKYGKIFRGSEINDNISTADKKVFLNDLRIRGEIDFYASSATETNSILGDNVKYTNCHTNYYYDTLIDLSNNTAITTITNAIRAVFNNIHNNRPTYFHCQVGADRTGTLAYILEAMLGMNEVDLDIEYELTSFSATSPMTSLSAGWRFRSSSDNYGTHYREMIAYFKKCSTSSLIRDGVIAWAVLAGITIGEINQFRADMVEGNPETVTALINYNVDTVTLNASSGEIGVGETFTLTATTSPVWATSPVTWAVGDSSIATISSTGKTCVITGVAAGTTTVTATANNISATFTATVKQEQEEPQYTGNIVTQVGYTDNTRYSSSSGEPKSYAGAVAINAIPFTFQNDGKFKIHLSGIDWSHDATSCVCSFKINGEHKAIAYLTSDGSNAAYGFQIIKGTNGELDIIMQQGTQYIINQLCISGYGLGANAVIEQIFPIQ